MMGLRKSTFIERLKRFFNKSCRERRDAELEAGIRKIVESNEPFMIDGEIIIRR